MLRICDDIYIDDIFDEYTQSGLDPAKPLLDSIKKMVDAYYPDDLDDDPEITKAVKEPKVQWIYKSNFDDIVDEEEKTKT